MLKNFIYTVVGISLFSCASQTSPGGGPKDTIPPILNRSIPEHAALNVNTDIVELEFNELIKTDNPKEQLIITPRIDSEYEVKYRKDKVIIKFEESLEDSTTYTFNFREAIKDITEGNPPENLKLAFSTGDFLDSLSISGITKNLLAGHLVDNATIALYTEYDTLDIFTGPPLYLTKSNKAGEYSFENLKNGSYYIYAFADNNKNLTAESKSEAYGFKSKPVQLDSNVSDISLYIQNLDVREFEKQSSRQSGTIYSIKYNKYIYDYKLYNTDSTYTFSSNFANQERNTIQVFNNGDIQDSLMTFIEARDTLLNSITDTVYVKFEETKRKPKEFNNSLQLEAIQVKDRLLSGNLSFNKPIREINFDSIYIYIDSTHILPLTPENLILNKYKDEYTLSYLLDESLFDKPEEDSDPQPSTSTEEIPEEDIENDQDIVGETEVEVDTVSVPDPKPELKPHIYFGHQSFISVEQDTSEFIKRDLSFVSPENLGIIIINLQTTETHYEIQLINSKDEILLSQKNTSSFQFKNVPPGEYRLRVLIDSNQDGTWNVGNILNKEEPEPVYFYEFIRDPEEGPIQEVVIRANWEYPIDDWSF